MSSTKEEAAPAEPRFAPKIDARWALNLEQLAAVLFFGAIFFVLNLLPLRATDLWGHVAYGQAMLTDYAIPTADPWMPLAHGMQVIDSAWLSQLILGAVDRYLGPDALSHLFALVGVATYLVWARLFYLQTRRVWLSLLATTLLIMVGWSRVTTIRPENFAVLCFAILMLLAVRPYARAANENGVRSSAGEGVSLGWGAWIGIPLVMGLWANLHGSFLVGWAVLGCFFLGRVLEVLWQSRSASAVLHDGEAWSWLIVGELAVAATLVNPYGLDLLISSLLFAGNENLRGVFEWQPLVIGGVGGWSFALSMVLLLLVWRHSRCPVRPVEVLLLGVFGLSALLGIRMLGWYAGVYATVLTPHLAEIAGRWFPAAQPAMDLAPSAAGSPSTSADGDEEEPETALPPGRSFRYSLLAVLFIWIFFALSPLGSWTMRQKLRTSKQLYLDTPVQLTNYLNTAYADPDPAQRLPGGQVFHPLWWGDWLKRSGPPELRAFVTTNIHLVPGQVWRDYNRILGVRSGWERTLDRYRVTTIIVDKNQQDGLLSALNRSEEWEKAYEDEEAAVFVMAAPKPGASRAARGAEAPSIDEAAAL